MVDLANIGRISVLVGEKNSILSALQLFNNGGRIVAFGINPASTNYDGPTPAVTVVSNYMTYPAQMATSITQLMQARLAEIQQQLTELGVTGIDEAAPRQPPAQPFGAGNPPPGVPPQQGRAGGPQGPKGPQFVGPDK